MNPKQRERLRAAAQQQTASQRKEKDNYYALQKEVSDDMRDAIIKEELAKSISYVPTPKQKRKEAQIERMADILVDEIKKSSVRKMAIPVTEYRTTSDASTSSEGVPGRSAYLYAKSTSPRKPQDAVNPLQWPQDRSPAVGTLQWLLDQEGKNVQQNTAPKMSPLRPVKEDWEDEEEEDVPPPSSRYTPRGKSKSELLERIAKQNIVKADGQPYAAKTLKGYNETQLRNVIDRHMGRERR